MQCAVQCVQKRRDREKERQRCMFFHCQNAQEKVSERERWRKVQSEWKEKKCRGSACRPTPMHGCPGRNLPAAKKQPPILSCSQSSHPPVPNACRLFHRGKAHYRREGQRQAGWEGKMYVEIGRASSLPRHSESAGGDFLPALEALSKQARQVRQARQRNIMPNTTETGFSKMAKMPQFRKKKCPGFAH